MGYSKNSPAYLVYNPQTGKVSKHRLVKFVKKNRAEQQTQTDSDLEVQKYMREMSNSTDSDDASQSLEGPENNIPDKKKGVKKLSLMTLKNQIKVRLQKK